MVSGGYDGKLIWWDLDSGSKVDALLRLSECDWSAQRSLSGAGVAAGTFRKQLDTDAVAAVMLSAAEGCLLQSATQGGVVPPGEIVKALMSLALSGG